MTDVTPMPEKPKRSFRMLQPTKDEIRAELARVTAERDWLRKPWWRRVFRKAP